jgi:hypothetical protein
VCSIKSFYAFLDKGRGHKSQFQYGWKGAWSIKSVSAWLKRCLSMAEKRSLRMAGKCWTD